MMCDNLSLYKTFIPSPIQSTTMTPPFYSMSNDDDIEDDDEHRPYISVKRKLSDYEDNNSSLTTLEHISKSFNCNNSDEDDDEEEEEEEEEGSSDDDDDDDNETTSDDESNRTHSIPRTTTPCTITQRRHSDTIHTSSSSLSYGTPIVKRRCTYSSMHDDEQKRSVLVESYRKLRSVKKPKLQVSLLICNLIKRLEKTFTRTPIPPRQLQQQQQQQQQQHVQYYQHRTTYRSSSSDSIYMSTSLPSSVIVNDEVEAMSIPSINHQYSPPHSSNYDSDKVLSSTGDLRSSSSSTSSMYHPSATDAYWLAQSNFAIPVVSPSEDDDVDVSLQGGGDYLDLSDNTLSSSFSSCSSVSSSESSISNDVCCSPTSSPTLAKLLVDTNNNNHHSSDDYYLYSHSHHHSQPHSNQDFYSHHHSSTSEQTFFYHHNGNNTVDIITTA